MINSTASIIPPKFVLSGSTVGLCTPERDDFVARWDHFNDPELCWLVGFQTTVNVPQAPSIPPFMREQREAYYERMLSRSLIIFDIWLTGERRCIGEAAWTRPAWPVASAELVLALYEGSDRAKGHGTEAILLMTAYAFDVMGLNRVSARFLSVNEAADGIGRKAEKYGFRVVGVEREAAWAFGSHQDLTITECLRTDFAPQAATAHLRRSSRDKP